MADSFLLMLLSSLVPCDAISPSPPPQATLKMIRRKIHGCFGPHSLDVTATCPEAQTHPPLPSSASHLLVPPVRSGNRLVSLESTWGFLTPKSLSFVQGLASFSQNSLLLLGGEDRALV